MSVGYFTNPVRPSEGGNVTVFRNEILKLCLLSFIQTRRRKVKGGQNSCPKGVRQMTIWKCQQLQLLSF